MKPIQLQRAFRHRSALTLLGLGLCAGAFAQDIVINELTQSNLSSYVAAKDFPDTWIEFYNPTGQPIELSQYSLGLDDDDADAAFKLPERIVAPGEYVVVSCDKNQKEMAIGDKIDSGKGSLYLFKNGEIIETLTLKKMPVPDVSYGRLADNTEKWGYFNTPTPGAANTTAPGSDVLPQPTFDAPAPGIQQSAFNLKITIPEEAPEGSKLCITLDGSEPTPDNAVEAPYQLNVDKSTVVKAKLICEGNLSPRALAHTYIFPDHDITLDIISISTDNNYLFSEEMGMLHGDADDSSANLWLDIRRPVNVEIFINGKEVINQTGEIALSGNSSRHHPQKPMKVYANKRFGEKRFAYPLWDAKPDVKKSKSFMLRNGGSAFTTDHLADEYWACMFGRNLDLDYQEYRPVVVYLNGEYYGLMDMRERSNEDWVEANCDGLEDISMFEDWWESKTDHTQQFFDFKNLMQDPTTTYEEMCQIVDTDEVINYILCEGYPFNRDWPKVNSVAWSPIEDIKWRYLIKDMDAIDLDGQYDFIGYLLHEFEVLWNRNPEETLYPFKPLLQQPEFCSRLVDRFVAIYGDFLKPSTALAFYHHLDNQIKEERSYHFKHWGYTDVGAMAWNEQQINLINTRGAKVFDFLRKRYGYGEPIPMTIDNASMSVCVNDFYLTAPDYNGLVFGGKPVKISPADNSTTNGWIMDINYKNGTTHAMQFAGEFTFVPTEDVDNYAIRPANVSVSDVMAEVGFEVSADGTVTLNGTAGHTASVVNFQGMTLAQTVLDGNGHGSLTLPAKGMYILTIADLQGRRKSYKLAF